jgi:urease accessory protein
MIEFSSIWFLEGFQHPLETPSHLILLVALGVLLGQQAGSYLIRNLLLFCGAVIIGFVTNNYLPLRWDNELILLLLSLLVSLLVVVRLNSQLPPVQILVSLLAMGCGMMLGIDSSPVVIPGLGADTFYNWLLGAATGLFITTLMMALMSALLRHVVHGIILRVLGSWIATSALFVLTLLIAKG